MLAAADWRPVLDRVAVAGEHDVCGLNRSFVKIVVRAEDDENRVTSKAAEFICFSGERGACADFLGHFLDGYADRAMRSTTPLPACGPDAGSTIVVPPVSASGSQLVEITTS